MSVVKRLFFNALDCFVWYLSCVFAEQTQLSNDVDFLVSVEEVKMHLSSQLAARKHMTEQLKAKTRLVRCRHALTPRMPRCYVTAENGCELQT